MRDTAGMERRRLSTMTTVRVDGINIRYRLAGRGPVTVLITQGLGFASAEWWPIQSMLGERARVVTWDRPGYGESDAPTTPRTAVNIAREALGLLADVAPEGPLVLVGHSQGGLYTNALARLAGDRVRGAVLLDPASPDNGRLRRELPRELFRRSGSDLSSRLRLARKLARLHLMGMIKPLMVSSPPLSLCRHHPAEARQAMWTHLKRAESYDTAIAEYEELDLRTSQQELDALGPFPAVPLEVLVHDPAVVVAEMMRSGHLARPDAERAEALWGELLRDQAMLSPLGRLHVVGSSGHLIHLEKPETTMDSVARVVGAPTES